MRYCQRCERPAAFVLGVCSECGYRSRPTAWDRRRAAPAKDWVSWWALASILSGVAFLAWAIVTW